MSRRLRPWVGLALAGLVLIAARWALDVAGQSYVQRWRARQGTELGREDARLSAYRRWFIAGDARDQNAAVWYRLSLAHIPSGRLNDVGRVVQALRDETAGDAAELDALMNGPCAESQSVRMVEALRSTTCFWGRGSLGVPHREPEHDSNDSVGGCDGDLRAVGAGSPSGVAEPSAPDPARHRPVSVARRLGLVDRETNASWIGDRWAGDCQ